MLQLNNLLLAVAIVCGAYVWYRTGFRTPRAISVSEQAVRRLVVTCGWVLVVGIVAKSIGGLFGDGRIQVAKVGQKYAHRTREPALFWGEMVGELVVVGGIGLTLITLGRRRSVSA